MIIAEQVKQAVQREDAKLGAVGMPELPRLPARHAGRNHDVTERAGAGRRNPPLAILTTA